MKRTAAIVLVVLGILAASVLCLPFLIDANRFKGMLESRLTDSLGRDVRVGRLKLSILSGGVRADDVSIADDPAFSRTPFVTAKSFDVAVELWPLLFSRKLNVTGITLEKPEITLIQDAGGRWNFSTLGGTQRAAESAPASGSSLILLVRKVKVANGRVTKTAPHAKPQILDDVRIEAHDFSSNAAFPFRLSAKLGGGEVQVEGKAGPLDSRDASMTPFDGAIKATRIDLVASGLVDSAGGIAGVASVDGKIASTGRTAHTDGKLKIEHARFAKRGSPATRTLELDWTLDHEALKRAGTVNRVDIHVGKATAHLTGAYDVSGPSAVLRMKLDGPNMPLPEFVALLPALDIVLPSGSSIEGGTANAHFTLEGPVNRLATTGSLGIENTRLAGFDLGAKMSAIERLAGIKRGPNTDIQLFSGNVRVTPEGTSIEDIKLVAPAIGEMTGGGVVSPDKALDFKMTALLHTSGAVMAALGQGGDTAVPFLIQGSAANPVFRPDMKNIASKKIEDIAKGNPVKAATGVLKGLFGRKKE